MEEKHRIVELTLETGASVSQVAQAEGVNANQLFQWRLAYGNGELQAGGSLTVSVWLSTRLTSAVTVEYVTRLFWQRRRLG